MKKTREIARIELFALSCRVEDGPVSSLALMPTRNGLLIRITSNDGAYGWGEAWCNYPPRGNLAKLNLMEDSIGPLVLGRDLEDWTTLRPGLERDLARMIIHVGEQGPFNHCLAALDMAAADLSARARGISLSKMLNENASDRAQVYASSPRVTDPDTLAAKLAALGHTGVKLKIGFDKARDAALLEAFRIHDEHALMLCVDANQNWSLDEAAGTINDLTQWDLAFVEEPIMADACPADWVALARACKLPLAAGENIASLEKFAEHVDNGSLRVIQPDVAKWGGISGCHAAGRHALNHGVQATFHYMGTALGLAASFHTLAALGGDGRVELDANPNPLRTELGQIDLAPNEGFVTLPEGPGIGFEPDPGALRRFGVGYCDIH